MIPTAGIIAVALNLFGRGRGHFACDLQSALPIGSEPRMIEIEAQLYAGKSPISKGIGELYEGLWCLSFTSASYCKQIRMIAARGNSSTATKAQYVG